MSRDFLRYLNKYRAWSNNPVGQVDRNGLADEKPEEKSGDGDADKNKPAAEIIPEDELKKILAGQAKQPERSLLLSTKEDAKEHFEGTCGNFGVKAKFTISDPKKPEQLIHNGGYVIQKVTVRIELRKCDEKGTKFEGEELTAKLKKCFVLDKPEYTFWEAFPIAENAADSEPDVWGAGRFAQCRNCCGLITFEAEASFYEVPKELKEKKTLPQDFKEDNPDTLGGKAPSTTIDPSKSFQGWIKHTPPHKRSLKATWRCCEKVDRTTLEYKDK